MNDPIINREDASESGAASCGLNYFWRAIVWFLILWTGALTLWLYVYSVRRGGAPCWDEFERCAWASQIWYGIRHFDLYHLWKSTNAQMVWPPLHSWMAGILFAVYEPSLASARLLSLLAFWGSGLLIVYWFVRRWDAASCLGAAAAWALFASAPIVVQQAVGVMSEGVGLFLALLILASLPQTEDVKSSRWALSGFLLGLFFFYKYNYAFLLYTGLGITRYFQRGASLRAMLCRANLLLFGIPILGMILWFVPDFGDKWDNLVYFAVNNPNAYQPMGFASFLYYPQAIPKAFFAAPGLAVLSLALVFIAAPLGWRLSLRNPIISCCLVNFIAVCVHPMKMERFQFITMGLFFIAAGEAARTLADYGFSRHTRFQNVLSAALALVILIPAASYQSDFFRREQTAQTDVYATPLRTAADRMKKEDRAALLITHDLANPPAATFYFSTTLDLLQRDLRTDASHWHHLFLFAPKNVVQGYSQEERIRHLRHELFVTRSNKIVVVETTNPQSSPIFSTTFAGVQEYINTIPLLPEWQLVFERNFPRAKANVRVYTMTQG